MITALKPKPQHLPLFATISVLVLLYAVAAMRYHGFTSWYQTTSLIADSAPLGLAAIGMTFVILSGGIDLSVGAVIAFSSIFLARCMVGTEMGGFNMPSFVAIPLVLAVGTLFGGSMGALIRYFKLPPFLVTLAGMFLARGLALNMTDDKRLTIVNEPTFDPLVDFLFLGFNLPAIAFLAILLLAMFVSQYTRFGRVVYAIGGNEQSAMLAGLPIGKTTIKIYALSGLCASIGGVLYAIGSQSGDASVGYLLELDAIATVVIGGTLLTGGVGYVFGTLLGVLILGIITIIPTYEGDLNSWWTRIAIGGLLFLFIGAQRLLQSRIE
ncbi:ABC transporter permease subunit [Poriferisphaera sp. WC338]|uniref:ABC transporter permease subunit n=1 Tax=Poriferisphaera sp. WC338 TaxID=3425129 RepID=UPI003D816040